MDRGFIALLFFTAVSGPGPPGPARHRRHGADARCLGFVMALFLTLALRQVRARVIYRVAALLQSGSALTSDNPSLRLAAD